MPYILTRRSDNCLFSEEMVTGFSCYVTNVYPEAVEMCRSLDLLLKQILKGERSSGPGAQVLEQIHSYTQVGEKEWSSFEDWVIPDIAVDIMQFL
jgi:hypothetical protein